MDQLDHHQKRSNLAREGYIRWRMNDLPPIYTNLMPVSFDGVELRNAEKVIREQYRQDQKMAQNPPARMGPECCILDFSRMPEDEQDQFLLENYPENLRNLTPGQAEFAMQIAPQIEAANKEHAERKAREAAGDDEPPMRIAGEEKHDKYRKK